MGGLKGQKVIITRLYNVIQSQRYLENVFFNEFLSYDNSVCEHMSEVRGNFVFQEKIF